ncbi:protein-tyrosine phosphatase 1 [Pelomyxa schiedti]|nr:protein-tyrosine phosphatase 1 [Pelomyxa schiedti]
MSASSSTSTTQSTSTTPQHEEVPASVTSSRDTGVTSSGSWSDSASPTPSPNYSDSPSPQQIRAPVAIAPGSASSCSYNSQGLSVSTSVSPSPPPMPDTLLEDASNSLEVERFLAMQRRQMQQIQQQRLLQQYQPFMEPTSPMGIHSRSEPLATPFLIENADSRQQNRLSALLLDPSKLVQEFSRLEIETSPKPNCSGFGVSLKDCNKTKNRYANVVPYDKTRVKLSLINGSDYINASFISACCNNNPSPSVEPSYIATQGPLPETFSDFWRMIWEKECRLIVMLTREREQSVVKVDRYWPNENEHSCTYGTIQVSLLGREEEVPEVSIRRRRFQLTHLEHPGKEFLVEHYQYTGWPDHYVPPTTEHIRTLIRLMSISSQNSVESLHTVSENSPPFTFALPKPTVVHCSAGIGRTGTFCAVHSNLEVLYNYCNTHPVFGKTFSSTGTLRNCPTPVPPSQLLDAVLEVLDSRIDVYNTVKEMRKQRPGMVQLQEQYNFCFYAVQDEMAKIGLIPESLYAQIVQCRQDRASSPVPSGLGL